MVCQKRRPADFFTRMSFLKLCMSLWSLSFYANVWAFTSRVSMNYRCDVQLHRLHSQSRQFLCTNKPNLDQPKKACGKDKEIIERIETNLKITKPTSSLETTINPQIPVASLLIFTAVLSLALPSVASAPLGTPNADPRYFLAGGICAAASHGATTPLDVIKTKIQSNSDQLGQMSWGEAAKAILEQEGQQILLAGLVPTIVGYGFEGALKFGLYESLKPMFGGLLSDPTEGFLIASVTAGAVASIVLCPMEQTRIRLVTDPNFANGFMDGVARLLQEEGPSTLFFGLPAMLSKQVPYTMAKQVSFDVIAGFLYSLALQYSLTETSVRTEDEFFAAFGASILACIASHPGDVILTATYKDGSIASESGFRGVISQLFDNNGIQSFFAGITARFYHVGAIITSQLILYDIVKQMLGLPATGTH